MLNVNYVEIQNFNGLYLAGSDGSIWNRRKQMKTYKINSGYQAIILTVNGQRTHKLLHRLIAEAFIPNPDNKPEVNHKDGDKANCAESNLEWVTSAENKQHAIATGLKIYNMPSKGIKLSNISKYHNVGWDRSREKWFGVVRHNKKNYYQKRFNTEIEAALHVNWILDRLGLHDRPRNIIS